jgi:membrane-bound lytic murein transglycosylase D
VVKTTRKMDTKRAAELAELSLEDFVALNPQHNRPVIAGADEYSILLPIDNAELFAAKLELTDQPLVSWQAYRMKAGETLPQVAAKYGMSVETLKAVNGLGSRSRIHEGHTLLVPAQRPSLESVQSLQLAVFTAVPSGRTFYYTAARGDTLPRVAVRYGVTVQELKSWNSLSRDTLAVGQKLRVTSDVAPSVAKAGGKGKRVAATRGAGKQAKAGGKPVATKAATTAPAKTPVRISGQFRGS